MGISALPIHYNTELFGPDALKYNPDRWIHGSNGFTVEEMNKYWIPFGVGSRQCIGKNVALLEVYPTKLLPVYCRCTLKPMLTII